MHINPTFPNVGDSNWGGPLDTALNTIVSKVNALDDALVGGPSAGTLAATYLSKAAPPTLDGVARFRAMVRGGAIVAPGTGVKAFDTSNEPPNQQWFIDAFNAGFRLYIAHGTYWDSDAPYPDIEPLLGQAIYAGMKVALYTRNPAWYREGIAAAGKYTNQLQFFALDVETDPGVQVTRAMVDDIKSMGIRPIIYTGSGMWPQVMGNSSAFSDVPLWDTNTAAIDYTTWTANLNSPGPQQYAGWNDLGTMRVGVQQKFDQVVNGIDLDLNTFDPAFLGMAKTGPLIGIGDDHTDVTTSAQYFWQRLQTVGNQSGNGLAGVPSGAIVPQGNNQQKLYDYLYGLDSNNTLRAALDLKPSVIVASWLTHDVRQGRLGLTVDGIRMGGSALLHELINRIQATNPEALIVLRVPFPFTTVDGGSHYITDGTNVNPAGLAQIYTDGVRLAYYDAQRMHPDVILYDPQTRLTGTTSPSANTGWWANQITQSQSGYQAEADDFAAFFVAPPSATQLAATYATKFTVNVKDYGAKGDGVTDDTAAIKSAMTAAAAVSGTAFFPAGTYLVSSKLPYVCSMEGASQLGSTIKATGTWTDAMLLDFNVLDFDKHVAHLGFDASFTPGVGCFGSSSNGQGSSKGTFVDVRFMNTAPGVYAVGGTSTTATPGMLTGAVFIRPTFTGCAQHWWIGNNQDDVHVLGYRADWSSSNKPTSYIIAIDGRNAIFESTYIGTGDTAMAGGEVALIRAGSGNVRFVNTFIEADSVTVPFLFHASNPTASLSIEGLRVNIVSGSLTHIIRGQVNSGTGTGYDITVHGVSHDAGHPTGLGLFNIFTGSTVANYAQLKFSGVDQCDSLFAYGSGSTSSTTPTVLLEGVYRQAKYSGLVNASNGLAGIVSADSVATGGTATALPTTGSQASPSTNTFTLPSAGVWDVEVTARVNGSLDHMANARFTVYYYVATNNTLVTEQVGTGHYSTGSSFGVNGLTLSNPTAGGVLTGSVTWADGNSHAVIWSFTGRRISNFNGTL